MGKAQHEKGYREENNLVNKHKSLNIYAERVPLSGAVRYQGNGGDVDIYYRGKDQPPITAELKARGNGEGFKQLEKWMGDHNVMFLKRNKKDPMVVVSWDLWIAFCLCSIKMNGGNDEK